MPDPFLTDRKPGDAVVIASGEIHIAGIIDRIQDGSFVCEGRFYDRTTGREVGCTDQGSSYLTVTDAAFKAANIYQVKFELAKGFAFTREGVQRACALAAEAESLLRAYALWDTWERP